MADVTLTSIDTFRSQLRAREQAQQAFLAQSDTVQGAYHAALEADFRKQWPRRTWSLDRAIQCPNLQALRTEFQARVNTLFEQHQAQLKTIDATLASLAETLPVWTNGTLRKAMIASAHTFMSQGYGASRYADRQAQMIADKARYHGLTAEVRPEGTARTENRWGITYQDYAVWVNTDEDGWELLRRKAEVPLKEWLRLCWKRGVNPRVYDPFLRPGLEEELGIDYFGNDVTSPATLTRAAA